MKVRRDVIPVVLLTALAAAVLPSNATAAFGFLPGDSGFSVAITSEGGEAATLAGSHPYQMTIRLGLETASESGEAGVVVSDGDLRDLNISMPAGLIQNATVVPTCSTELFQTPRQSPYEATRSGESCPANTQIGLATVETSAGERTFGLFNLAPPPGVPSEIGFSPFDEPVVFRSRFRRDMEGEYALDLASTNTPQRVNLRGLRLAIWGTPWGVSHNGRRGNCLNEQEPEKEWGKCSVGEPAVYRPLAYLTLPTTCSTPPTFAVRATAWGQGGEATAVAQTRTKDGQVATISGCNTLTFDPHPFGRLTNKNAVSASGFNFQLTSDDDALIDPRRRINSQARRVVLGLPPGVTINPSLGAGLGACTREEFEAETAANPEGAGCPNASKIGDFSVETPLYRGRLTGAIYLATPDDPTTIEPGAENPFDKLISVYLIAREPIGGILLRLAGSLEPDAKSGQITAVFPNLPQLPYSNLELNFRPGQRAPLVTPPACGTHYTQIEMAPWSGAAAAHAVSESVIDSGIGNLPCPTGAALPFAPAVVAGAVNSNVGSYSPYFVHITRQDTEQEVTSYSLVLPKGITGRLAGIPFCSDQAIAEARSQTGTAETSQPSCPAASQVGKTVTGYGVGPTLTYAPGRIFLAGPYHGAPLSLVTINAATVGPFDLGTIVIRSAFSLDERTAQLAIDSSGSDPIPHILDGIPLHLRDIRIYIDRPSFTRNPTGCEPAQLISRVTGSGATFGSAADDSSAMSTVPFHLLNCGALSYAPRLGLKLRGGTRLGAYPALQAVAIARPGDANLKSFSVTMPHTEFLAQNHVRGICTNVQFAASACPRNAIYGHAAAFTPLFDMPLRGPVYLRSSGNQLPDLVADLRSGSIRIVIDGRIGPAHGGIAVRFTELPDAPLTRFVMRLAGGGRGLLQNSSNICANPPLAAIRAVGQNNRGAVFHTQLRAVGCQRPKHVRSKHHRRVDAAIADRRAGGASEERCGRC